MFRLPRRIVSSLPLALVLALGSASAQSAIPRVASIRYWAFGDVTRIAIETEGEYRYTSDQLENPFRLYFDFNGLQPPPAKHRGIETIHVGDGRVKQIRIAEVNPHTTRVVFDLVNPVDVVASQLVNPDRLMIEIRPKDASRPSLPTITKSVMGVEKIGSGESSPILTASAAPTISTTPHTDAASPALDAIVEGTIKRSHLPPPQALAVTQPLPGEAVALDLNPNLQPLAGVTTVDRNSHPKPALDVATPAKGDANGERSLVRVFGLKLGKVVIDAGHGGHDAGTVGPHGLLEKDLVLDVATRVGKMIEQQLGARVIYTRSTDVFIPLEERTRMANEEKADLFISIHANSSPSASATGVETYYFNFTSDKSGLDLATRENATSQSSISDLNDLLRKAVLNTKLEESRDVAQKVQSSLSTMAAKMNSRSKDRGVRRAPFVVLIGATMPSILAEVGFVSNPHDETLLKKAEQRQKIADALFRGVSQYASSLSHTQIARVKASD